MNPRVAIIDGIRTPFVKAGGALADRTQVELLVHVVEGLFEQTGVDPRLVDELALSSVLLNPRTPNLAREVVIRSCLPKHLPAHFVSNNCISGLLAAAHLSDAIRAGRINVGVAGGVECMSAPTLTLSPEGEQWWMSLFKARSAGEKLKRLSAFRLNHIVPQPPSPREPSTGLTMGEHCELIAKEFGISRDAQDRWALRSHQQAAAARDKGLLAEEILPLAGIAHDSLIRKDSSLDALAALRPVFDRSAAGTLTAGNSSSLTDGASAVLLANADVAKANGWKIKGYLQGIEFSAVAPEEGLLMAPALAVPRLLKRLQITSGALDRIEMHEAFAAQVLATLKVWKDGWQRYPEVSSVGELPEDRINVNGGSLALGHPFAATGGRLLVSIANELQRSGTGTGLVTACAAGAMGCAMVVTAA